MVPLLTIIFTVNAAVRHDCVPGPVLANASCTMDIIRECNVPPYDNECRTVLECFAGLQLNGIRSCVVPMTPAQLDVAIIIAEIKEASAFSRVEGGR